MAFGALENGQAHTVGEDLRLGLCDPVAAYVAHRRSVFAQKSVAVLLFFDLYRDPLRRFAVVGQRRRV